MSVDFDQPAGPPAEVFTQVLDASAALLASERVATLGLPDDELHREILLPLLPEMLGDEALREYWLGRGAAGFLGRLSASLQGEGPAPRWDGGDFEIHVTASYRAGADARALADTLLSEDSLRDLAAEIMNRALAVVWQELPRAEAVVEAITETIAEAQAVAPEASEEVPAPAVTPEKAQPLQRVTWSIWLRWPRWKRIAWWRAHGDGTKPWMKWRV